MKTITVDILDDKAINLLKDLEALNILRIKDEEKETNNYSVLFSTKYSGALPNQPRMEIDHQLEELRNEWD